jgi:hypothetical protein
MKRILGTILFVVAMQWPANGSDPMVETLNIIRSYFNEKTYYANQRHYNEADLAIPDKLLEPLRASEISYLGLLRNEIFARHGYEFESGACDNIFNGLDWYEPRGKNVYALFNDNEVYNIEFIKKMERKALLDGERLIKGWPVESVDNYFDKHEQQKPDGARNKAELEIIKVSPTVIKPEGRVKVVVRVKNTGANDWAPIGLTKDQEAGKYYISSCWVNTENQSDYAVVAQFPLPKVVKPGESVAAEASIIAPSVPGQYGLIFSVLQSMVQRFIETPLPSAEYEYNNCPKVYITIKGD